MPTLTAIGALPFADKDELVGQAGGFVNRRFGVSITSAGSNTGNEAKRCGA